MLLDYNAEKGGQNIVVMYGDGDRFWNNGRDTLHLKWPQHGIRKAAIFEKQTQEDQRWKWNNDFKQILRESVAHWSIHSKEVSYKKENLISWQIDCICCIIDYISSNMKRKISWLHKIIMNTSCLISSYNIYTFQSRKHISFFWVSFEIGIYCYLYFVFPFRNFFIDMISTLFTNKQTKRHWDTLLKISPETILIQFVHQMIKFEWKSMLV